MVGGQLHSIVKCPTIVIAIDAGKVVLLHNFHPSLNHLLISVVAPSIPDPSDLTRATRHPSKMLAAFAEIARALERAVAKLTGLMDS